ncbi:TMEM165/GDT1 family protein [Chitinimonas arctica]|uniref:GDT1 family protein n=1 Tax=Chitinimonas arctica TaxID=2594795 RepID=A0A516SJS4_9NEIS|nr:TMEM165/GDT1 family protein [Chitinimonas arctica]QDQ28411.1 TMEM165/GDT1 family protein [Chitinimonas arctica]
MQAFFVSTGIVALAEIGDKTQLLALLLAAKFRKPVPIVLGILLATLLNHALAGAVGSWLMAVIGPQWMRWILGVSFLAMAGWILIPDQLDQDDTRFHEGLGVFGATVLAFFLAEMGDKTQFATVAIAARYADDYWWVIAGTTAGMMLANAPVVWIGNRAAQALPVKLVHRLAAGLFAVMGILALLGVGG